LELNFERFKENLEKIGKNIFWSLEIKRKSGKNPEKSKKIRWKENNHIIFKLYIIIHHFPKAEHWNQNIFKNPEKSGKNPENG